MERIYSIPDGKITIERFNNARVSLTITCRSQYEAKVLYDDLLERMEKGEHIMFEAGQ